MKSNDEQREFKGVWIPAYIWLDNDLTWTEKLLLVEIDSLAKNGECFASNKHFAEFFSLSKDRVSRVVSSLRDKGYVEVKVFYKEGSKQVEKRVIAPIGYRRIHREGIGENANTPIGENTEDINTSISNTTNKTIEGVEKRKRFVPPSTAQVADYAAERGFPDFDADKFVDFYASKGWMVGRSKMKDWRASVRTWLSRERSEGVTANAHQSIAEAWGVR